MYLTHTSYLKKIKKLNSKYWNEGASYRWQYMNFVILTMQNAGYKNIIEAGASGMPLNDESYLFDYPKHDLDYTPFIMDCNGDEIKIPEKFFDCFVALQVFEHLKNQAQTFKEIKRISQNAILSFPYKWKSGDDMHRNIDEKIIARWTNNEKPVKKTLIKNRIIYHYKFGSKI